MKYTIKDNNGDVIFSTESLDLEEVEKSNESSFYGLYWELENRKSSEGKFAKNKTKKLRFSNAKDAIASPEAKAAMEKASEWANKKGYAIATINEIQTNKKVIFSRFSKMAKNRYGGMQNDALTDAYNMNSFKLVKVGTTGILVAPKIKKRDIVITDLFVFFKKKNERVFNKRLMSYSNVNTFKVEK